jgi:hypothetical protein
MQADSRAVLPPRDKRGPGERDTSATLSIFAAVDENPRGIAAQRLAERDLASCVAS